LVVKRQLTRKRSTPRMALPHGSNNRPRRQRFFRTRRKIGLGWLRQLPLLWIGAVAVCVFLLYLVLATGAFSVKTVEAPNLAPKDLAQVIARCQCIGDNIFVVRPDDIQRRLKGLLTLDVNRVYTTIPNTVHVEATYKTRVAIWRTPEAAYAVAADAEVLQVWRHPYPHNHWKPLPIIDEGYDSSIKKHHRLLVGEHVPLVPLTMALSLRSRIPTQLRALVKGYVYRPATGITMVGRTNWWALLGVDYSSRLDQRVSAVLTALTESPPTLGRGDCVDLRATPYMRHDHSCG
jgi:hypothetical protein